MEPQQAPLAQPWARERSRSPRRDGWEIHEAAAAQQWMASGSSFPSDFPSTLYTQHVPDFTEQRFEGKILSVSAEKGFGFVECPSHLRSHFANKDVFVHRSQMSNFQVGDIVSFSIMLHQDGKPQAKDIRMVRSSAGGLAGDMNPGLAALVSALAPAFNGSQQAGPAEQNQLAALATILAPVLAASQGSDARAGNPWGHAGGSAEASATFEIEVHNDFVGALVGRGGSSIQDLQRRSGSGVHIQMHPPRYEGGPQIAQVTGPASRAAYGADLVRNKVEEIRHGRLAHRVAQTGQVVEQQVMSFDRQECVHELEVSSDIVGALVGKQGCCIQELQRRAGPGVHIQIYPSKVPGGPQLAQIKGPAAGADVGFALVQQKIREIQEQRAVHDLSPPVAPSPQTSLATDVTHEVEVPIDVVGSLIGKQGASIHELERRAGAGVHIQISPMTLGNIKMAQITGPPMEAATAKVLVQQRVEELLRERDSQQEQVPDFYGQQDQQALYPSADTRLHVEVPADLVGALLGGGGLSIHELQAAAGGGVHIQLLPAQSPMMPHIAEVTGPATQATFAASLVQQRIEELRRERDSQELIRAATGFLPASSPGHYGSLQQGHQQQVFGGAGVPQMPAAGADAQALAQAVASLLSATPSGQ